MRRTHTCRSQSIPPSPSHSDLSSFSAPFPTHHPQLFIRRRFEQAIAVSIDFLRNRGERLESYDEPPWLEDGADRRTRSRQYRKSETGCSSRARAAPRHRPRRRSAVAVRARDGAPRPGRRTTTERPLPSSSSSATTLSLSPVASSAVAAFKAYWSRSAPCLTHGAWLRFCFFRGEYDYVKSALGTCRPAPRGDTVGDDDLPQREAPGRRR